MDKGKKVINQTNDVLLNIICIDVHQIYLLVCIYTFMCYWTSHVLIYIVCMKIHLLYLSTYLCVYSFICYSTSHVLKYMLCIKYIWLYYNTYNVRINIIIVCLCACLQGSQPFPCWDVQMVW